MSQKQGEREHWIEAEEPRSIAFVRGAAACDMQPFGPCAHGAEAAKCGFKTYHFWPSQHLKVDSTWYLAAKCHAKSIPNQTAQWCMVMVEVCQVPTCRPSAMPRQMNQLMTIVEGPCSLRDCE